MSSNRLIYDTCAYDKDIAESGLDQLSYTLDPNRFYRCAPCRPELGIVGGNNVSLVKGNLVDLENDLRGQTRLQTRCPDKKNSWMTKKDGKIVIPKQIGKKSVTIDTNKLHLPPCQLIRYDPVNLPPPYVMPECLPPAQQMQYKQDS
jgi:hypothetical protein